MERNTDTVLHGARCICHRQIPATDHIPGFAYILSYLEWRRCLGTVDSAYFAHDRVVRDQLQIQFGCCSGVVLAPRPVRAVYVVCLLCVRPLPEQVQYRERERVVYILHVRTNAQPIRKINGCARNYEARCSRQQRDMTMNIYDDARVHNSYVCVRAMCG